MKIREILAVQCIVCKTTTHTCWSCDYTGIGSVRRCNASGCSACMVAKGDRDLCPTHAALEEAEGKSLAVKYANALRVIAESKTTGTEFEVFARFVCTNAGFRGDFGFRTEG